MLTTSKSTNLFSRKAVWLALGSLVMVGAVAGVLLKSRNDADHKLAKAKEFLDKGFPVLAAEALDDNRSHYVTTVDGCATLLKTYRLIEHMNRLKWTIESCQYAKVQLVDLDLASAWLSRGQKDAKGALTALQHAIDTFPTELPAYLIAASVLDEQKDYKTAVNVLTVANQRFPKQVGILLSLVDAQLKNGDRSGAEKTAVEMRALPKVPTEAVTRLGQLLTSRTRSGPSGNAVGDGARALNHP